MVNIRNVKTQDKRDKISIFTPSQIFIGSPRVDDLSWILFPEIALASSRLVTKPLNQAAGVSNGVDKVQQRSF